MEASPWMSGIMLVLSLFFLSTPGETVNYFLIAAALAIVPLALGKRRTTRIAGLALVIVSMAAAGGDHQAGMSLWRGRWAAAMNQVVQLRSDAATAAKTRP